MRRSLIARRRQLGLRGRAVTAFALGGLVVSAVLSSGTYLIARGYLVDQREASAQRQAFADASFVRDGLLTTGSAPGEIVGDVSPRAGSRVLIHVDGQWYSSDLTDTRSELPPSLVATVVDGSPAQAWVRAAGQPMVVTGTPLPAVDAEFYEVAVAEELRRTLDVLRIVLLAVGAVTALGAAVLGRYVAARVLQPLDDVAAAATAIAAGRMDTRLSTTEDPDLIAIVGSFNAMVDGLEARIEREARFTADVSHELRSPLTTLVTGVELLCARRDQLPERSQQALDLVSRELERFQRTLEDLLELARLDADAGRGQDTRSDSDIVTLVHQLMVESGRDPELLKTEDGTEASRRGAMIVKVDRRQIERALGNLLENAERHGHGITSVQISRDQESVYLTIDDAGAGVAPEERERIFARFARTSASRGSTRGTGLGLSLVTETAHRHHGSVWCTQNAQGGARFVLRLPLAEASTDTLDPSIPVGSGNAAS